MIKDVRERMRTSSLLASMWKVKAKEGEAHRRRANPSNPIKPTFTFFDENIAR